VGLELGIEASHTVGLNEGEGMASPSHIRTPEVRVVFGGQDRSPSHTVGLERFEVSITVGLASCRQVSIPHGGLRNGGEKSPSHTVGLEQ
jgi:hypothetical protein